jgi:hypothetical protein
MGFRTKASAAGGRCSCRRVEGHADAGELLPHADRDTMLAVMSEPRKVSEKAAGTRKRYKRVISFRMQTARSRENVSSRDLQSRGART